MSIKQNNGNDFVWTPEIAYAVGLIVTDGNLSKDGRHIAFRSVDFDQIKNFKKCLALSNKIGRPKLAGQYGKRVCYRLQFSDVRFYQWLLKIGVFPAKTYNIGPIQLPDEVYRDFLRGHLDGDGSIVTYLDKYNTFKNSAYQYTRLFVRFISTSRTHIEWIQSTLVRLLAIKGDIFEVKPTARKSRASLWQLKFMKKESIKLLSWIYYGPDISCLRRKRRKAEKILGTIAKIKRKPYVRLN